MILMEVHYYTKPERREDFLEEVSFFASLCKAEEGNFMYDYYLDPDDDDHLLLLEKWENEEILAAHFQTHHFKEISALKDKYVLDTKIHKHYIK